MTWLRTLLIINAVVGIAFGAVLLVAPAILMNLAGQSTDAVGLAYARLYGAELLGFATATWFARNRSLETVRPIVYGHVINESLTAIVIVLAALAGTGNALVWVLAIAPAAFAVAFALAAARLPRGGSTRPLPG